MEISSNYSNLAESLKGMGDLLKNVTNANMGLADKLLKANVTAKVEGLGENIDIQA